MRVWEGAGRYACVEDGVSRRAARSLRKNGIRVIEEASPPHTGTDAGNSDSLRHPVGGDRIVAKKLSQNPELALTPVPD